MSNKRNASETCHGAKLSDVILDLIGQSDAHLEDVSFGLFALVALAAEKDAVGVEDGQVVFEEAHVDAVALEAVL